MWRLRILLIMLASASLVALTQTACHGDYKKEKKNPPNQSSTSWGTMVWGQSKWQ